ncbi:hypothetical protein N7522_009238 [Penicillium canescens]|uniref:Hikeshi-like domain-containing protein n=1 Tax=Penicillium canescens TaxID=5083 RepID=A0AAD6N964_PENCN|nr:uncharacterized protein N7446_001800 [Penicillium canescens]KAJ5997578.1 hypothetical protein N7522_009238 [Penicillium canescens]KAJ6043602.1 hypothetical protein N7460_004957 [Penicillium canescens]KAJ6055075.1 hypothetical protein N7444_004173 [Penicillium canescens]KAJ6074023.1 hypothetical protein N7446_001800 [Penicillium canescens]
MFSVVIPGRPCLTDIVAVDGQPNGQATKFAFTIPLSPSFSELVVFFLPGTVLPPNTGAAIYAQLPDPTTGQPSNFRFIGALANEKPSGIFTVRSPSTGARTEAEEEDDMLDEGGNTAASAGVLTLGISIEEVQAIAPQLAALEAEGASSGQDGSGSSTAMVTQGSGQAQRQISTKVLAQRIIGSAFNYLASFAETDKGQDVVPLKSFRDWWTKFERRIDVDPTFLERQDPNANS